jgi:ketosteroid isomerase-like protein
LNLTLEQFKDEYLTFLAALNRGDLVTAFAVLAPNCEFRTPQDMPDQQVLVGREQVIAFFEQAFEVLPDWHIESVRILQAADDVFVALDQGRVSARSSAAPTVQEIATVSELRDLMVVRVHQYTSWEEGLRASGLDPSIAADVLNPSSKTG